MERINEYLLTFLLNAAWQVVMIAGIAALANHLIRKGPARYRHILWVAAMVAAVLLPLTSIRRPEPTASLPTPVSLPAISVSTSVPSSLSSRIPQAPSAPAPVSFPERAATAIVAAYFLFVVYRIARFAKAWSITTKIRSHAERRAMPPSLEHVWQRSKEAFGIKNVELLVSPIVSSPVALGAIRPAVIVPECLWTESSEAVLGTALGHELAHVARRDFAVNLLCELLYLPVSFHPACRLIRREMERTREMACDEAVTLRLVEPWLYARSILQIAAGVTDRAQPGYTLGVFDGNALEQRIRRLLELPAANLRRARVHLAAALAALVVCIGLASTMALTARAQSEFQTQMKLAGDAYNDGDFKTAVDRFNTAVTLEPANVNARLFLANALMRHFYTLRYPDASLPVAAVQQYREVLSRDSNNKQATAGMTAIALDNKQFREAREWAEKLAAIDANDKTAWYTLGVLDWAIVFPEYQQAKQAAGGRPEEYSIADSAARKRLRDEYLPQVQRGLQMLERTLLLDPEYEQAVAYMNLLYRLKSGLVDDLLEAKDLIAKADAWVGQALAAKKRSQPVVADEKLNVEGPPPGPAGRQSALMAAPPPPPPPPPPPRKANP
jgi:beta-lactamase regulating signal transducer with metallopeptidase domain